MTGGETVVGGAWRELLGPRHLAVSTVLAGGVGLYATNEFLTISLLPSVVDEIGGTRLYAWVTTVYLVASIVVAATVHATLARLGSRWSYLVGLTVFGAGSVLCAAASSMEVLLAGRLVQGAAGGLIAGLGYAVMNAALPRSLWTKGSALVSAMWGVGTLLGPTVGGAFAQSGAWRSAFVALALLTGVVAVLVPRALPPRADEPPRDPDRVPVRSLLLLTAAALTVSVAVVPRDGRWTALLVAAGAALAAAFFAVDRRTATSVLPGAVYRAGPSKWIYLTLGILMAATMVDLYVPYFGRRLAHLTPLAAAFLGVAIAVGWTTSEIVSASATRPRVIARIVAVSPLVMAAGLLAATLGQVEDASAGLVALWVVSLLCTGVGIGMAWPHLSAWAMSSVTDPADGGRAAAAINTVQLVCGVFGAGLAGVVVNATDTGGAAPARWVFAAFALLAAVGVFAARRSVPPARPGDAAPGQRPAPAPDHMG
ncbi:MFS transporter [Nocardia thailandica]